MTEYISIDVKVFVDSKEVTPGEKPVVTLDTYVLVGVSVSATPRFRRSGVVKVRVYYRIPEISKYYSYFDHRDVTFEAGIVGCGTGTGKRIGDVVHGLKEGVYTLELLVHVEVVYYGVGIVEQVDETYEMKLVNVTWPSQFKEVNVELPSEVKLGESFKATVDIDIGRELPLDSTLTITINFVTPSGDEVTAGRLNTVVKKGTRRIRHVINCKTPIKVGTGERNVKTYIELQGQV